MVDVDVHLAHRTKQFFHEDHRPVKRCFLEASIQIQHKIRALEQCLSFHTRAGKLKG